MDRRSLIVAGMATMASAGVAMASGPIPRFWQSEWPNTDFSLSSVPFDEIFSGGVPKDGIPALDRVSLGGDAGLDPREPVITVALEGKAERAYPVRYLIWHEIANDEIDGIPVAVTYCPLCNSAVVFDRRVGGNVLSFGVSGKLRNSDMVMYDRQTESWWQQFDGIGIVGHHTGTELVKIVNWMEPLESFLARNPGGAIMQRPRSFMRMYGANPYEGYDSAARPFLYRGAPPPHGIPPLERVVRVDDRAWPLTRFEAAEVIEEAGLRLEWKGDMASALDSRDIPEGRQVSAIRVFDQATGRDVVHDVVFAFAFHAFVPDGTWMLGN